MKYISHIDHHHHRKRIKTEEKAKDVAAVWGTEFIIFLFALAMDGMKKRINCIRMMKKSMSSSYS